MTNADILKKGIEDLGLKCSDETACFGPSI